MNVEEFKKYIESIGFKLNGHYYVYKEYRIFLYIDTHTLYIRLHWIYNKDYNDLTQLNEYFKNELRSIKLKKILSL